MRTVRVDSKTGLVRVSVRLAGRILAAHLVNEMVARCNATAQAEEVREAENRINFLMSEALSTQLVSLRNELYSVINMEIHRVAVLKSRRDFALRVIDPAFPADEDSPTSPDRFLIGALGLLCGLFGTAALLVALQVFGRARPQ